MVDVTRAMFARLFMRAFAGETRNICQCFIATEWKFLDENPDGSEANASEKSTES